MPKMTAEELRAELQVTDEKWERLCPYTKHGTVYVLKCGAYYKIGWCRWNVDGRISHLQIGNPYDLRLICRFPGTQNAEREVHRHFARRRHRGEWFKLDTRDLKDLEESSIELGGEWIEWRQYLM